MSEIEIKFSKNFVKYESALDFMKKRVEAILYKREKEMIWFLNHNHIYTQGTSSSDKEIIKKNKIKIFKTNRGGKITYHGPGQRVVYFMINLNNRKKDIRTFISLLENSLILFLKKYNIQSKTFHNRVGIWVIKNNKKILLKEKKIGAIGLRISKWVTYHGLSFNINPDLKYYKYINACGLSNYQNTSLKELGVKIDSKTFDTEYSKILIEELNKYN